MDQPLLTSSPQRASEAPILQSTIAQHTDAAFHCASYPSAPHFNIRALQHLLQKIAITHTQNIFHIFCFLYVTNNSLEATALVKSKGMGYRASSISVSALPWYFVVWVGCLNTEGLGRAQISWKTRGLGGGGGGGSFECRQRGGLI